MSSLGDILQSLDCVAYLKNRFPDCRVDWIVESRFASLVQSSPYVDEVFSIDIKNLKKTPFQFFMEVRCFRKKLQMHRYDVVWDLQGNCKSALFTYFCHSKDKVGFGKRSVAEWPNLLVTNVSYEVDQKLPISKQYVSLLKSYFQDREEEEVKPHILKSFTNTASITLSSKYKIMVCPGSNWINKQLSEETLLQFLQLLKKTYDPFFVLIWGNDKEKALVSGLAATLSEDVLVVGNLDLALWQDLMCLMDSVIAVDSCALHLAALANIPTFSIFGPSSSKVYKPFGDKHIAYAGVCPYGQTFIKRCPQLRSCKTGACMKKITAEALMQQFSSMGGK